MAEVKSRARSKVLMATNTKKADISLIISITMRSRTRVPLKRKKTWKVRRAWNRFNRVRVSLLTSSEYYPSPMPK